MKVKKTEHGIELEPENRYEEECLNHIAGKALTAKHQDQWERKGPVTIEFKPHPWDEK